MSRKQLRDVLAGGHPIDPEALDDTEFRGVSLGLPAWMDKLAWKTFCKTFARDADGTLRGWNVRMQQTGLDGAFDPIRTKDGRPKTFGHYHVVPANGHRTPRGADRGLLIHYGLGGNGLFDPMRRIRDPLVSVNGDADLLLGWSYVDFGFATLGTPSWFTLERRRPLTHDARPPRP